MALEFKEKCNYEVDYPQLILGVTSDYKMKDEKEWKYIQHQYAGHLCYQLYIKARVLRPKEKYWDAIHRLTRKFDVNHAFQQLDAIIEYRSYITEHLGMDCNYDFKDLEEALYPIDCTEENVEKLTGEKINNLDDLIEFESDMHRLIGSIGRWKLYIVSLNSD